MELKQKILRSKLFKKVTSEQNIFYSIYSVQSYIFEKELLEKDEYETLIRLGDIFNNKLIRETIENVRKIIQEVVLENKLFETTVYFKPKDIKDIDDHAQEFIDRSQIISRPIHTSDLYTQIAIASILNGILYEEVNGKMQLSEFGRIFPKNFYGNIPSEEPNFMFEPWQKKYNEYSKVIGERYSRFVETKEYSHEINIDLENFYPSIHPLIVYDFIVDVLSSKYKDDDYECLKIMILKLLYLEVTNQELNSYYCLKENKSYNLVRTYTQGIPQGLPQAYLFGNICMLKVGKIYEALFEGEAFFYVDDSVIYTNKFRWSESSINDFEEKIKELNKELENLSNITDNLLPEIPIKKDIIELNAILDYTIRAHSISGKSEIYEINNEKLGNPNLNIMGRAASISSFELATTFSDFEELTLMNRFKILKDSILAEINRIDPIIQVDKNNKELKNYRERLVRYKKFMTYRERILKLRSTNNEEYIKEYIERLENLLNIESKKGKLNKKNIVEFFKEYKEDVFWVELIYILRRNNDHKIYNRIKKMINKFDDIIYGKSNRDYAYLSKVVENLDVDSYILKNAFNKYASIQEKINRIYPEFPYKHERLRNNEIASLVEKVKEDKLGFFRKIDSQFNNDGYYRLVCLNTDELYRLVLNVYISKIYGVYINDSVRINKIHNRPITYRELRILVYIRNNYFNLEEFILFAEKIFNEDSNKPADYAILDVIDFFVTFIKRPKLVDNMIQIHRFTNEIWKNGSKFLYFYTLHNEEHAIALIKAIGSFLKNADFLQIGQTDYYILFISCYLHDVSMVLHPDLIKVFNNENNLDAKRIASSFEDDFDKIAKKHLYLIDPKELKDLLIKYYKKIDGFLEKNIRERHAKDSAAFIRGSNELSFIEKATRELVAETSAAHWYNPNDIYDVKSNARNTLISKKFIKILLRIADLLDVSDSRVSNAIYLNNNIYMSNITRFHWLSHQAISGYSIETKYKNIHLENKKNNQDDDNKVSKSYISKDSIEENIVITFYLNRRCNLSTRKAKAGCLYCALIEDNEEGIEIGINYDKEVCSKESCKFLCKWMILKHGYLFQELFHLQRYLKRAPSNCFITKFSVKFMYNPEAIYLNSEEQQIIKDYIDSQ